MVYFILLILLRDDMSVS